MCIRDRAHPDLAVGDDSPWVVLNASAWEASADPGLRDVLRYLRTGEAEEMCIRDRLRCGLAQLAAEIFDGGYLVRHRV